MALKIESRLRGESSQRLVTDIQSWYELCDFYAFASDLKKEGQLTEYWLRKVNTQIVTGEARDEGLKNLLPTINRLESYALMAGNSAAIKEAKRLRDLVWKDDPYSDTEFEKLMSGSRTMLLSGHIKPGSMIKAY
jgi:hypothetical protein